MRTRILMVFLVAVSAAAIALAQAPPIVGTAPVRLTPSTATPLINGTFTMDVAVDLTATSGTIGSASAPAALSAFRIPITFDTSRLQLVSVTAGQNPAFAAGSIDATDPGTANAAGRLTITGAVSGSAPAGVVSVATLTFSAAAAGNAAVTPGSGVSLSSAIDVSGATLYGPASLPPSNAGGGVVVQTPAALALSAAGSPAPVVSGATVVLTLAAENTGGSAANGVTVSGAAPASLTFLSSSPAATISGNTLTWSLGAIAAGQTARVTASFTVNAAAGSAIAAGPFTATASNVAAPANATTTISVGTASRLTPSSILAASSLNSSGAIYDITSGQPRLFATVPCGGWTGPIVITTTGRVLVATNAKGGSVWDITTGGDLTSATPVAQNLYPSSLSWLEGMTVDAAGNIYVSNAEIAHQQIAKIAADGTVSYLPTFFDDPSGLVAKGNALYVSEGATGTVKQIDLTTFAVTTFASGFQIATDHFSGQLAFDPRGHLFVYWGNAAQGNGLYDITAGGDFSTATPATAHGAFRIDMNQIAFDTSNNAWFAGDGTGYAFRALFSGGSFGPAQPFVGGLGDTESLAATPVPPVPVLTASVSAPAVVATGSDLTCTIAYQNVGGAAASNVVLTAPVPSGATFGSASSGGTLSGATVTWTVASLAQGASGIVTLTVHVTAAPGAQLSEPATIAASSVAPATSAPAITNVVAAPALTLTLAAASATATGGDLTYFLTAANAGGIPMNGVTITEALPAGTSFSSATDAGAFASGTVTWNLGTIAAEATRTVSFTVQVTAAAGATVTNAGAHGTASNASAATSNPATTNVLAAATLTVSQTAAPNPTVVGGRVTFALTFHNAAATAATNAVLVARLPRGGSFIGATGGASIDTTNGIVTWSFPTVAAGATATVRFSAYANVAAGTTLVSDDVSIAADNSSRTAAAAAAVNVLAIPQGFGPGTILDIDSNTSGSIWDLTNATRTTFGIVPVYAGPIVFGADGHAYVYCSANNGSIYDVTPGGDLRGATPIVRNIYPSGLSFPDGAALDTAGNLYVTNSEANNQLIAKISPFGEVSYLPPVTNYASALIAVDSTLYYSEGGSGTVKALDLNTNQIAVFASGFSRASDHYSGQFARDRRGHLFVLWSNNANGNGLFDITAGGDFSTAVPLTAHNVFRIDVNQIAVDLNNNLYFAGNGTQNSYRSLFDPATGTFGPTNGYVSGLGDNESIGIFPIYNLTVAATASATSVSSGDTLTFTLAWTSHSITPVTGAAISATIPAGTHVLSVSNGGTVAGGNVAWQLGTVAAQASGSVTMTVVVDYPPSTTITLNNYSIVADGRPASTGPSVSVPVVGPTASALGIEATASATSVVQGGTIAYTLKFENDNTVAASGVTVTDPLPAGATFVSASNGGALQNGAVVWTVGTVAAGGSGSVTFTVLASAGPSIINGGYAITATGLPAGNGPSVTTQVVAPPVALTIAVAETPSPATSGQTMTYTLHAANGGASTASSTTIDLAIPAGTTFASANAGGTATATRVSWTLGALAPGTALDVAVVLNVTAAGGSTITLADYGVVSAQAARVAGTPLTTPVVAPPPPPPLGITIAAPATVTTGDTIVYTITVTNGSSTDASNVTIVDPLPNGTSFVTSTGAATMTGSAVQWSLGTLAANDSVALALTVRATAAAGSTITNSGATATADGRDPSAAAPAQTAVVSPPATLQLGLSGPATTTAGGTIVYTLTYTNNGPGDVTAATLSDPLPSGTTFVSAPGATIANGIATWPLGALTSGASTSVTLTVIASAPAGATITNSGATFTATGAPAATAPTVQTDIVFPAAVFSSTLATDQPSYTAGAFAHESATFRYVSGGAGLATNLTATLTTTNSAGAVVASLTQPIASIAAGAAIPVTYDWNTGAAPSGSYTVTFIVIDAAGNTLAQSSVTIAVAAPDGAHLTGTIAPTNSPVISGVALQLHVTIANQNAIAYTPLPLEADLLDPATLAVAARLPFTINLGATAGAAADVAMPTASLNAQDYIVWLTTSVGTGHLLATSKATVVAPQIALAPPSLVVIAGSTGSLTLSLTAPLTSDVTVALVSSDPTIASVPATITIPAGTTSQSVPVHGVSVGGPVSITATLGVSKATSSVTVVMTGTIAATLQVYQGENVTFAISIANGGAAPLNGTPFAVEIHNPSTGTLIDTVPFTATIAAGATFTKSIAYGTSNLAFQKYEARLVYAGPPPATLAAATFEVLKPPPLRLSASIGGPARVLIWSSCSPGNSGTPCAPVAPPFLTQTLRNAGIAYRVVGDEDSFLAAMRTGGFTCAVIDQANPAEPKIAPEYLIDVHAGFGLLFIHSAPDAMPKLDPALGTAFRGVMHGPTSVNLLTTPFTSAGTLTLNGDGVAITLAGARAAATTTAGDPAISYDTFGRGNVVVIPFDLEQTPTVAVARLILSSVGWVSREVPSPLAARDVVPLQFAVTTPPGSPIPVTITVTLPAGASVVDALPPFTTSAPLTWSATLDPNSTTTFVLWLRAPDAAGTVTVSVDAGLTGGPPVVTKTVDLTVASTAATLASDLATALNALKSAATTQHDLHLIDDAIARLATLAGDAAANVGQLVAIDGDLQSVTIDTGAALGAADRLAVYWQSRIGA